MENTSGSTAKISSTIVKGLEIALYQITFCHFPFKFHTAERLLHFDILGVIFNEFEDTFVFACISLVNFPFSV